MKKDDNSVEDLSWKLFENTGEVSYYLLYKALKDNKDEK